MARVTIDIEDIPPSLSNKVKQDLKFKTGNFVWRVRFNIPLDPKTVNKDTMYVSNSQNEKLRTYIKYNMEEEIIEIEPLEPYSTNEYYYLIITTNVKSRGGQSLSEPIKLKFNLEELLKRYIKMRLRNRILSFQYQTNITVITKTSRQSVY